MITITILHHSNGTFSVGRSGESRIFKTSDEAWTEAERFQTEAGGPTKARIIEREAA